MFAGIISSIGRAAWNRCYLPLLVRRGDAHICSVNCVPVMLLRRGEPGEVRHGARHAYFSSKMTSKLGFLVNGHDHIHLMCGHDIQALFTFYLSSYSCYVNSFKILDFGVLL